MSNQEYIEDEINLVDHFIVLWKHKWFILAGSIVPTLIIGSIIYFLPCDYTVTYTYDVRNQTTGRTTERTTEGTTMNVSNWNLNEKNYAVLISGFYSEENMSRIMNKLQENGLNKYKALKFEPIPPYTNLSKLKVTDSKQLERIWNLTAQLLKMTIIGKPKEDLPKIACVIRENFESVLPVYMIHEQLSADIRTYKIRMADIESNRFSTEISLKANRSALERLKNTKVQAYGKTERDVILQFDVGNESKYLPLEYQIHAVESDIIELEKQVGINESKYNYYKDLLALTKKLSAELTTRISTYYTIQQFHSFLTNLTGYYKSAELNDYLASYIKRIETRISINAPVLKNPKIFPIAKGTVRKSAIVFAVAFMLSIFVSFLREGIKKTRLSDSKREISK